MADEPRIPLDFTRLSPEEMVERSRALRDEFARRRSVRDFDPTPVPREVLENAILAAGSAPSGANMQPWHFVVVTDPEIKHEIRELAQETERSFYDKRITDEWRGALEPLGVDTTKPFLTGAPALIVVFRRNFVADESGKLHKTYYPMESTGLATGMLIAALHMAGLATLPYTPSPMAFLRDVLERPETDYPFLVLAAGYPTADATVPAITREPLESIATFVDGD